MEISFSRANKIKSLLIRKGFSEDQILIEGKGDLQTLSASSDSEYNAASDRRVEIFFISK